MSKRKRNDRKGNEGRKANNDGNHLPGYGVSGDSFLSHVCLFLHWPFFHLLSIKEFVHSVQLEAGRLFACAIKQMRCAWQITGKAGRFCSAGRRGSAGSDLSPQNKKPLPFRLGAAGRCILEASNQSGESVPGLQPGGFSAKSKSPFPAPLSGSGLVCCPAVSYRLL